MLIGNKLINEALKNGSLVLNTRDGCDAVQVGTNSVDVTLSPHILITEGKSYVIADDIENPKIVKQVGIIDPMEPLPEGMYRPHTMQDSYILKPNEFILASANEAFNCTSLGWVQHYDGRSTMARLGVLSHVSAGFGDYGFNGVFTLEIKNLGHHAIVLRPNMRIGQVYFEQVTEVEGIYDGYTQNDFKPQVPRLGKGRF